MPTLTEAKNTAKKYQMTGEGVFEEMEVQPGQSYYQKRGQGGYELVSPDGAQEGSGTQPFYSRKPSGGVSMWRTPSTGGGNLSTISSMSDHVEQTGPKPVGTKVTTTSQYVAPAGPQPEYKAPSYKAVGYNKRRVSFLRQQAAGPARRAATQALQRAFTSSYSSGPLRDMAIRNALREYGSAYAEIMAGAGTEARREYEAETAEKRAANLAEYQAAMSAAQSEFAAAWNVWAKSGTTETTQTSAPIYEDGMKRKMPMIRPGETMNVPTSGGR